MNCKIFLSATFIAASFLATAQDARTYAVTGDGNNDYLWRNIREINLSAGKLVKDVMVTSTRVKAMDAISKKELTGLARNGQNDLVAASAFDKVHNKLFFSTMQTGQLRWIDLSDKGAELKVYRLQEKSFTATKNITDEAENITRMCIGADGNGYAISNDANHFYMFTTGKKTVVTDLGNIVDADANRTVSIHNKCTSWGGDMVADAFGKLYIISASHNVFALDVDTRIATHIGTIKGLPGTYTTNGAAVEDDENIVVSSANTFDGFYKVNFKDLSATKIEGSDKYNASDLANGNLLYTKRATVNTAINPLKFALEGDTRVYPNPVTGNEFKVLFDKQEAGKYNIALTDLTGRVIQNRAVIVSKGNQVEPVRLLRKLSKGVYLVKVTDESGQTTFSDKIVIN